MKIKYQLIILFLIVSMIPLFVIGSFSFFNTRAALKTTTLGGLNAIAEFQEAKVLIFLDKLRNLTKNFATDGLVVDSVENINNQIGDEGQIVEELTAHLIDNKLPLDNSVSSIDILTLDGRMISSTVISRIGINKSDERYFYNVADDLYMDDIHRIADQEGIMLGIGVPIMTRSGVSKKIGVLVIHFDVNQINKLLTGELVSELGALTQLRGIGETGETYLVNQDKLMVTDSLFIENAPFNQLVDTYPVRKCFEDGEEIIGIWENYRGVSVVGSSMCISVGNFKLTLLSEQDENETLAPVNQLRNTLLLVVLVVFLMVIILSYTLSRSFSVPLENLSKMADRLSRGDLNVKTEIIKSNNEVGRLSRTFNQMTHNLSNSQKKLKEKIKETEKINRLMIGREIKMMELKKEINNLKNKYHDH